MRIGWLVDQSRYMGGAEMAAQELATDPPDGVTIVNCPANGPLNTDVDCYVVHNCNSYNAGHLPDLMTKPVIKVQHDVWPYGDPVLRTWLLFNARLFILGSPVQKAAMPWNIHVPYKFIPHSVDIRPFRKAAQKRKKRSGVFWLGRMENGKGLHEAAVWANSAHVTVDAYGYGSMQDSLPEPLIYKGKVDYKKVPDLMARYETFLFLPTEAEPYNRSVVEAWAAGCNLVVNSNVGPVYWINEHPDMIENAHDLMWGAILEAVA